MEAWLKFRAPGITLPLGLGIGKLVFAALNKVEVILLTLTAVTLLYRRVDRPLRRWVYYFGYALFAIVAVQTAWLLPVLSHRADLHITGAEVPASSIHLYYVLMELAKMILLITLSIQVAKAELQYWTTR